MKEPRKSVTGSQSGQMRADVRSFYMMELVESGSTRPRSREQITDNISRDGMVHMLKHLVSKLWLKQLQVYSVVPKLRNTDGHCMV